MDDFQQNMEHISKDTETARVAHQATVQKKREATTQLERSVTPILASIGREFTRGDKQLTLKPATAGDIGFSLTHPGASLPYQFAVSAVCNETEVKLMVTDGKWEEVYGVIGNWGNWTDQKQVYSGPVDEYRIRKSLEKQFLAWYQRVSDKPLQ